MKIKELFENTNTYTGNIIVPTDWTDLTGLPELFPGYTPGCILRGNFSCINCTGLTSLEGAPSEVYGYFNCVKCTGLTSLEGAPQKVHKFFSCAQGLNLTSLKGAPQIVLDDFSCFNCTKLVSLEGAPQKVGEFNGDSCTGLTSLEGIGKYYLTDVDSRIILNKSPINSHILGLLKVKNLKEVELQNKQVEKIINRYLAGNKDAWKCQDELQDLDLDDLAQL